MKVVTERMRIRTVAQRWLEQYQRMQKAGSMRIYAQLCVLDVEKASAEDVAKIIGNNSWCGAIECDECGAENSRVLEINEREGSDYHRVHLCRECVRKAWDLMD